MTKLISYPQKKQKLQQQKLAELGGEDHSSELSMY
jgi:hypothetical protein